MGEYRKYIQNQSNKKRSNKNPKRKRGMDRYLYYGTAILIVVALICALQTGLWPGESDLDRDSSKKQTDVADQPKEDTENQTEQNVAVNNPDIRVLIKTSGYGQLDASILLLSSSGGLTVECGGSKEEVGQSASYAPDDPLFGQGNIRARASDGGEVTIENIERGYGCPSDAVSGTSNYCRGYCYHQ